MKEGIHLGRPRSRPTRTIIGLLVLAGAGALALTGLSFKARVERDALASEVASHRASSALSRPAPLPDLERTVAARLRLALDAGAPDAIAPTALLSLVESALPEDVVLENLAYGASPRPSLQLELSTLDSDRVTELERRLAAAPIVASTSLLEERRQAEGRLAVRIQVDLKRP